MAQEYLYGVNTVLSLLKYNAGNRKIYEVIINPRRIDSARIKQVIKEASGKNIIIKELEEKSITNILRSSGAYKNVYGDEIAINDQGVIASVSEYNYADLDMDIKYNFDKNTLLVLLDGITDVGNFGSILRNCSAFGVNGVMITKKRSAEVNQKVGKISSGALEEIKIYCVANLSKAIEKLKNNGFWIYGTTLDPNSNVSKAGEVEYFFPLAIVFGSEGSGMHRLVKQSCDFLVSIRMAGRMQSLNVATSSGIFLYIIRKYNTKNSYQ